MSVGLAKATVTVTGFDVSHAVWGFRFLATPGVIMAGVGVFLIARTKRVSAPMALALAIANPLVLVHLIGGAHNDALMMGLLVLGVAAFERGRKILAVVLVYLILVAQFQSFLDPFLILLAIPTGLIGVALMLWTTGTTLNVMSLMGVVMMMGIVVSNSILIVEFTRHLRQDGTPLREALITACRVRLRPILMTSLATLIGLAPMALALGAGSEAYAPLARAIIGGLGVSVVLTMFVVPAAYLIAHRRREPAAVPS